MITNATAVRSISGAFKRSAGGARTRVFSKISITPNEREITYTAGSTTYNIRTSGSWTVAADEPWVTFAPSSGTGDTEITATYTANPDMQLDRTATITATSTTFTGKEDTSELTQDKRPAMVGRYNHAMIVHDGKMWLSGGGVSGILSDLNDLWYTDDGENWYCANDDVKFGEIDLQTNSIMSYDGKLYIKSTTSSPAFYYSEDGGITWSESDRDTPTGSASDVDCGTHYSENYETTFYNYRSNVHYYVDDIENLSESWKETSGAPVPILLDHRNQVIEFDSVPVLLRPAVTNTLFYIKPVTPSGIPNYAADSYGTTRPTVPNQTDSNSRIASMGSKVLQIGGGVGSGTSGNVALIYDPSSDTWTETTTGAAGNRYAHGMCEFGGAVYVSFGSSSSVLSPTLGTIYKTTNGSTYTKVYEIT
jgi:hypothetical protein